jgi:hypothetical protein
MTNSKTDQPAAAEYISPNKVYLYQNAWGNECMAKTDPPIGYSGAIEYTKSSVLAADSGGVEGRFKRLEPVI